jgi:hypothetical protein
MLDRFSLFAALQRFHCAFLKQPLDSAPLGTHVCELELVRASPRNHDEIHAVGQERRPLPEALAAQPLHTVPLHGATDLARHDEPEARRSWRGRCACGSLRRDEEREVRRPDAAPRALRADELLVLSQPAAGTEGVTQRRGYFL